MKLKFASVLCPAIALAAVLPVAAAPKVELLRTPSGGIQPQAVTGADGTVHLIYFAGAPQGGNLLYARAAAGSDAFSRPIRVNSRDNGVMATGTIRGGQLAFGKNGRVHVVWNGNAVAKRAEMEKAPLFYTRLNDAGTGFEPERNVVTFAYGLDGGSSVAADAEGNVHVVWHGRAPDARNGEMGRGVFVASSRDDGKSFAAERQITPKSAGVCPCCGLRAFADRAGDVFVLYRVAEARTDRDMLLLMSRDRGATFETVNRDKWQISTCPMSSATITQSKAGVLSAWETAGQVHGALVDPASSRVVQRFSPPAEGKRKHPVIVANDRGEVLMAWTDGTGWARGGAVEWQVFDADGKATAAQGRRDGVPAWSLATAYVKPDGGFAVIY